MAPSEGGSFVCGSWPAVPGASFVVLALRPGPGASLAQGGPPGSCPGRALAWAGSGLRPGVLSGLLGSLVVPLWTRRAGLSPGPLLVLLDLVNRSSGLRFPYPPLFCAVPLCFSLASAFRCSLFVHAVFCVSASGLCSSVVGACFVVASLAPLLFSLCFVPVLSLPPL